MMAGHDGRTKPWFRDQMIIDMTDSDRPLILVVDDDRLFRDRISDLLVRDGYDVTCAGDSYQALQLSRELHADAVLLDVELPDISGPRLCGLLRQVPGYESTPIIFTTAHERPEVLAQCLGAGGNDFVRKSLLDIELPLRLRNHLERQAELKMLQKRAEEQNTLLYFARLLNRSLSMENVLQSMVEELGKIMGADRCSVIVWNEDSGQILATAESTGSDVQLLLDNYPEVSEALHTRQAVYIPDVREHSLADESGHLERQYERGIQSILVVPMTTNGNLLGTLFVRTRRPNRIPEDTVAACQAAAEIACRAVVNARIFEQVRRERDALLRDGASSPVGEPNRNDEYLSDLRELQLNVTAEALSAINLIGGYAELLVESRDIETMDARLVRVLRNIQVSVAQLEEMVRLFRMLPVDPLPRPGNMATVVDRVMSELAPLTRQREITVSLQIANDCRVYDTDGLKNLLRSYLRQRLSRVPANTELVLAIDDNGLTVQDAGPHTVARDSRDGTWQIWNQAAKLSGVALDERRRSDVLVETVFRVESPRLDPAGSD